MPPPQWEEVVSWFEKSSILAITCLVILTTQLSFALQTNITLSPYESLFIVMCVTMLFMCILTIHPLLLMVGLILSMVCEIFFIRDKALNSSHMLYAGVLFLMFGVVSLSSFVGVLWLWKKVPPGAVDIGLLSASIQMFIIQLQFIIFTDGYFMISQWIAVCKSEKWHLNIVGNLLMYFPDSLLLICCVLLLLHKIRVLHQNTARVEAFAPPSNDAV